MYISGLAHECRICINSKVIEICGDILLLWSDKLMNTGK